MVSKACVVGTYQSKLEALASYPGMDLVLITPPYWREPGRVLRYEPLHTRGYRTYVMRQRLNGRFHVHWYPGLTNLVAQLRPDLVHIDEEPADVVAWQCQRAANLAGARTLFFTWQNLYRPVPLPFRSFQHYVFKESSAAISGNRAAHKVLRRKGYPGPISIIPQFGFDDERFTPGEPRPTDSTTRILFAGRFVQEKGVLDLMRAAHRLTGEWCVRFIGGGPLESRLRSLAADPALAGRVEVTANVPSKAMPDMMRWASVLVQPSQTRPNWKEQFGRSVCEAMCTEVPVVVSDSGELPFVAGDGGLIVPEGDVAALTVALQRLVNDPALRARIGRQGRARVQSQFTQRAVAKHTLDVYERVLGHASPFDEFDSRAHTLP